MSKHIIFIANQIPADLLPHCLFFGMPGEQDAFSFVPGSISMKQHDAYETWTRTFRHYTQQAFPENDLWHTLVKIARTGQPIYRYYYGTFNSLLSNNKNVMTEIVHCEVMNDVSDPENVPWHSTGEYQISAEIPVIDGGRQHIIKLTLQRASEYHTGFLIQSGYDKKFWHEALLLWLESMAKQKYLTFYSDAEQLAALEPAASQAHLRFNSVSDFLEATSGLREVQPNTIYEISV